MTTSDKNGPAICDPSWKRDQDIDNGFLHGSCDRIKYMGSPFFTFPTGPGVKSIYPKIEDCSLRIQRSFCDFVSNLETKNFRIDRWERQVGKGGGISCVLQYGQAFDKAGANVSSFTGILSPQATESFKKRHPQLKGDNLSFFVAGVSAMLHPVNPYVPAFHFNLRYFDVTDAEGNEAWWFGGCCDLSPCYIVEEEIVKYHKTLKGICDKFGPDIYKQYKGWCDEYFFIKHRGETRGIGGIFFDDLHTRPFEECFSFFQTLGKMFLSLYRPFVDRHLHDLYTEKHKNWQLYLRGRHVEFVLLYDRGLRFGLNMPTARVESVMMTLPPQVRFDYNFQPEAGSEEARALEVWKQPRDWV